MGHFSVRIPFVSCIQADMRRVGLLGGTFDPPHLGHAIVADQVGFELGLDAVLLVPASRPWQKDGTRTVTSAPRRFQMTSALLSDLDQGLSGQDGAEMTHIAASDVELELGEPSYTMVTLEHLRAVEPETEFIVVVGSDAAAGLDTWHRADELREAVQFAVVSRPGPTTRSGGLQAAPAGFDLLVVDAPAIEISSTELRSRVGSDRSIRFLTTPGVIALVSEWGLYRPGL